TLTGGAVEAARIGGEAGGGAGGGGAGGAGRGGVSNVRTSQSMPLMTTAPGQPSASAPTGPAARALELARPFLRMVEGAVGGDAGAHGGGGGKSGNPAQEIEELARQAFDELQRLIEIARERSGHHG